MRLASHVAKDHGIGVLSAPADGPRLRVLEDAGRATALVWPGVGARERSMNLIELPAGRRTLALCHPSEAVYFVKSGGGHVAGSDPGVQELIEGSMVHIGPQTTYRFEAGKEGIVLLGGPCPFDPALYA